MRKWRGAVTSGGLPVAWGGGGGKEGGVGGACPLGVPPGGVGGSVPSPGPLPVLFCRRSRLTASVGTASCTVDHGAELWRTGVETIDTRPITPSVGGAFYNGFGYR